nr:hypothetical protein [Escherichia coli]
MAEEKKGGVSVYISSDIVEALKERHQQNVKQALRQDLIHWRWLSRQQAGRCAPIYVRRWA